MKAFNVSVFNSSSRIRLAFSELFHLNIRCIMSVKLCCTNIIVDLRLVSVWVGLQPEPINVIIYRLSIHSIVALHFCKKYLTAAKFTTLVLFPLKY